MEYKQVDGVNLKIPQQSATILFLKLQSWALLSIFRQQSSNLFKLALIYQGAGEAVCTLLLRLAERAIKHNKFTFAAPTVVNEEEKENEETNQEGDDDGIQEDLENKEMPEDDLGEVDRGKGDGKPTAEEDE